MKYEIPEEDLAKAFESDSILENISAQYGETMDRFNKDKRRREAKVVELKAEVAEEVRKARIHAGIASRKRYQIKQLNRARKPPGLLDLNRRIARRKATVKNHMLRDYLGTMRGDFLRRWKETHKKGSHEDSEKT